VLKDCLIVDRFHAYGLERLALAYAILLPPVLVLVFCGDHGVRIPTTRI